MATACTIGDVGTQTRWPRCSHKPDLRYLHHWPAWKLAAPRGTNLHFRSDCEISAKPRAASHTRQRNSAFEGKAKEDLDSMTYGCRNVKKAPVSSWPAWQWCSQTFKLNTAYPILQKQRNLLHCYYPMHSLYNLLHKCIFSNTFIIFSLALLKKKKE